MKSYRSEHPNHVHQLTVSASKHYYITKDGRLKYQHKPMEIRLDALEHSDRTHVVHYIIRDHFSGLFYSEIAASASLPPVEYFLNRAWRKKDEYVFCGIPKLLTIPQRVETIFPTVKTSVLALGVGLIEVTSGFQGGVRDVRTVEDWLKLFHDSPMDEASLRAKQIAQIMGKKKSRNGADDKASFWMEYVPEIRVPPDGWGCE